VPQVRLIGADGEQLGIVDIADALKRAQDADLDLVEVAAGSKPPVTRLLDYSKYKYEQEQKLKQARKHQQQVNIREIKLRPKIATHDYETKKGHVERFLRHQDKVKITIMFRGREVTHPERGVMILDRLAEELAELGVVEQRPTQDGRNMTMMLGPSKAVLAGKADGTDGGAEGPGADGSPDGMVETPDVEVSPVGQAQTPAAEVPTNGVAEMPQIEASPDGDAPAPEAAAAGPDGGQDGAVS